MQNQWVAMLPALVHVTDRLGETVALAGRGRLGGRPAGSAMDGAGAASGFAPGGTGGAVAGLRRVLSNECRGLSGCRAMDFRPADFVDLWLGNFGSGDSGDGDSRLGNQ